MPVDAVRAKSLLLAAADLADPAQRGAYLDRECGGDAELRARVEALLRAGDADSLPPDGIPDATTAHTPTSEPVLDFYVDMTTCVGATLDGKYNLAEEIGAGGMGTVYRAQQTAPVRRAVAVKVIKAGMDSQAVLARFEAERQALALMEHPNIARVLDAGTTAAGRPYFVMELVNGVPITKYCDEQKLTPRERLELFVPVCLAIQHAHQKGIIHRDIKPSNVLVAQYDDQPVPKVIDFGVAKAAGSALTDKTVLTGLGTVVGTPEYMSPEQASVNNLDIDTRSDVYSLGVLLYELLTGSTPVDRTSLSNASVLELLRIVREVEAPRPSRKLITSVALPSIAASRSTEPTKLPRLLKGELDWVLLKALEKDRARRYETADALARDLRRYLANEVVEARPPSAGYRFGKFVRRHKVAAVATGLVLLALLAGITGTSWGLIEARRQKGLADERLVQAESEKKVAQAVRDFLQRKLLAQTDTRNQANALLRAGKSSSAAKLNPTIRELLDRAAKELASDKIEENFPQQPLVQAEILQTIGNTYRGIGEWQAAIDFLKRSEALRRTDLGPGDLATQAAATDLATAYRYAGKPGLAAPLYECALQHLRVQLGPDHPDTLAVLDNLAQAYRDVGQLDRALPLFEEALRLRKTQLGPEYVQTLESTNNLASALFSGGQPERALPLFMAAFQLHRAKLGPEHPDTLVSMNNLAVAYQTAGKLDLAVPLFEESLALKKAKLGHDHPETLTSMNNLATAYRDAGQLNRALPLLEETLKLMKDKLGADHPSTLASMTNLAAVCQAAGQLDRAVPLFQEMLAQARKKLSPNSPLLAAQLALTSLSLLQAKAFAEAEPLLRECLAIRERRPRDWSTFNTRSMLGGALLGQKKYADAGPLLQDGYGGMKQGERMIPAQGKVRLVEALDRLIEWATATNQRDELKKWQAERAKYPLAPLPREK